MPFCPTHGPKPGAHCDECGLRLLPEPAGGDRVSIRSPEAQFHNTVAPTIVLSGGQAHAAPLLVKCPKCGKRNMESGVFDCQGPCGRQNLCQRHFDEECDLCRDCAAILRGEAAVAAAAQQALMDYVVQLQGRVVDTEAERTAAEAQAASLQAELVVAQTALQQSQNTHQAAEQALAEQRTRNDQLSRHLTTAQATIDKLQQELAAAQSARQQSEAARRAAAKALAAAEAELIPYHHATEAARCAEGERRARESNQPIPTWKIIGIEVIKVPAGEFRYGENKQKISLTEFWIAKTPVTNRQYKAFVDATSFRAPSHWQNRRLAKGTEDYPVVNVSWEDAQAFCQWAGVRLPKEKEWEKAARGTDGREYPWGNQKPNNMRCNFGKFGGIENLAPVGSYPNGVSPYGLLDMAGNIWEWCEDCWESARKHCALRGGSYYDYGDNMRCAYRHSGHPGFRNINVGFRVVSHGL